MIEVFPIVAEVVDVAKTGGIDGLEADVPRLRACRLDPGIACDVVTSRSSRVGPPSRMNEENA